MRLLHLTLLYFLLTVVPSGQTLESPTTVSQTITTNPITTDDAGATNIIYQSNDGGATWQDISHGLPQDEEPEGFFAGESELYLKVNNEMYRSRSDLKTPVWEKEDSPDPQIASIAFNRSGKIVGSDGVLVKTDQKGIMRSTDNGEHWQSVIREGGVGIAIERIEGGFAAIAFNTTTQTRRIHISLDNGKTWEVISEGLRPSSFISSIKQVGGYLVCGHPDGIFRSSDLGKTWNSVHSSVDKNDPTWGTYSYGFREPPGRVFTIYGSGNVLYAVAGSAGC